MMTITMWTAQRGRRRQGPDTRRVALSVRTVIMTMMIMTMMIMMVKVAMGHEEIMVLFPSPHLGWFWQRERSK